jgi:hypothetical protein
MLAGTNELIIERLWHTYCVAFHKFTIVCTQNFARSMWHYVTVELEHHYCRHVTSSLFTHLLNMLSSLSEQELISHVTAVDRGIMTVEYRPNKTVWDLYDSTGL